MVPIIMGAEFYSAQHNEQLKSLFPLWLQRCSGDIAGLVWSHNDNHDHTSSLWQSGCGWNYHPKVSKGSKSNASPVQMSQFCWGQIWCFIIAKHISEVHNTLADALSRDSLPLISHKHRNVSAKIPPEILEVLINQWPNWTLTGWASLFRTTTYLHG